MVEPIRSRIDVVADDITLICVDAIVNAANPSLLGGGGVDGAIHAAAGPGLLEECRKLGPCPPGEARISGGHDLPAKFVIHAVGPVWRGGDENETQLLRAAYYNSLRLAQEAGVLTLAFPCISTGIYGFPKAAACDIAIDVVSAWLKVRDLPRKVTFVCFEREDFALYRERVKNLTSGPSEPVQGGGAD